MIEDSGGIRFFFLRVITFMIKTIFSMHDRPILFYELDNDDSTIQHTSSIIYIDMLPSTSSEANA